MNLNRCWHVSENAQLLRFINNDQYFSKFTDKCPNGWKDFEDSCYLHVKTTKSFKAAEEDCRRKDSSILVINSKEEERFIKNDVVGKLPKDTRVWLGLRLTFTDIADFYGGRKVVWKLLDSNEEVTYNNMDPSFDNALSQHHWGQRHYAGEFCATMITDERLWRPAYCSYEETVVCERPAAQ